MLTQTYIDEFNRLSKNYIENPELLQLADDLNNSDYIPEKTDKILLLLYINKYNSKAKEIMTRECDSLIAAESDLPHSYCLFTGRMRVIYTFLKVYETLKEKKYLAFAHSFFSTTGLMENITSPTLHNGLLKGRMGIFVGLLIYNKYKSNNAIIRLLFKEIIKKLDISTYGLINSFTDAHIDLLTDMAQGNAGMIWAFSELYECNHDSDLLPILNSFINSLNNQWNKKWNNWSDNYKKIRSVSDQNLFIEKLNQKDTSFFTEPANSFDFWNGTLGICISLINYLAKTSDKSKRVITKIKRAIKQLEENKDEKFKVKYNRHLYYLYISMFELTGQYSYKIKALKLLQKTDASTTEKLYILLSFLNDDKACLDIFPSLYLNNHIPGNILEDVIKETINIQYPRTCILLKSLNEEAFKQEIINPLRAIDRRFFLNFKTLFLKSSFLENNHYKTQLLDCFKYEDSLRKYLHNHKNKILHKTQDLSQRLDAHKLLNLSYEKLEKNTFILSTDAYILKTKWNWSQKDTNLIRLNFQKSKDVFYTLIKIIPTYSKKNEASVSENQMIFIEKFISKSSIKEAILSFINDFDIQSDTQKKDLDIFIRATIEQLIFNRFIILC